MSKNKLTDKCCLCGKERGEHLAINLNCPIGKKTRIGNIYYHKTQTFKKRQKT